MKMLEYFYMESYIQLNLMNIDNYAVYTEYTALQRGVYMYVYVWFACKICRDMHLCTYGRCKSLLGFIAKICLNALHYLPSQMTRQVIAMRSRPPFVCMYVYTYVCISVPVNPRHLDCAIAWCSPQALTTTKSSTWPPSATKLTAQHSTSLLHAAFRLLLTSPIAPAQATCLLVIPSYWLTFALCGQEHFHCSLG